MYRLLCLIVFLQLCSCNSANPYLDKINTKIENTFNSRKKNITTEPKYKVFHISNTESRLYYKVWNGMFLYKKEANKKNYKSSASLKIQISLIDNIDIVKHEKTIDLSKSKKKINPNTYISGHLDLNIDRGKDYLFTISLEDNNRNYTNKITLHVDKTDKNSKENFMILDSLENICFDNFITAEKIKIKTPNSREKIFISSYPIDQRVSTPPYHIDTVSINMERDTVNTVFSDSMLTFEKIGLYHLQRDTTMLSATSVLKSYEGYPLIARKENIALPLIYILQKEEIEEILASENSKSSAEKYWLNISNGKAQTARKLIMTYYNRVEYVNRKFSNTKEGWKTDRGMLYIVFGPPSTIVKRIDQEIWIYGKENTSLPIEFVFDMVKNHLNETEYIIKRGNSYKEIWDIALETWRSGNIFDEQEIIIVQENYELEQQNRNMTQRLRF
ncbi:GWxTD domain-containing protein [Ichthyobacterium seriolicida]|nr:GWxTD domain-containing protein [Ichthyobacterium seriolicida]